MRDRRPPRSPWRWIAANLSPEAVALALAVVVLIAAWLILRPGQPGKRTDSDAALRPVPSYGSIAAGPSPRIPLTFSASWPRPV